MAANESGENMTRTQKGTLRKSVPNAPLNEKKENKKDTEDHLKAKEPSVNVNVETKETLKNVVEKRNSKNAVRGEVKIK